MIRPFERRTALRCLFLMAVLIIAAGCGDVLPTEPAASSPEFAAVSGGPGVAASVRGGAHYQLKDPPAFVGDFKWIYRFSFNAEELNDGTDQGTVRFRSKIPGGIDAPFPGDWWATIEVDCLEVDQNIAWISGTTVEAGSDTPFGPAVGGYAMLVVVDNGPQGPDNVNVGPAAAFGATDCRDRPGPFAGALVDGNITVASRP